MGNLNFYCFLKLLILASITQELVARSVLFPYNVKSRFEELQNLNPVSAREECPENYSPCTCVIDPVYGESVTCANLFDPQVVQDVFSQTSAEEVGSVTIANFLFPSFPANFLSGKRARRIVLRSGSNRITINPEAFRSTANTTEIFDIVYMSDLTDLRFGFLSGFDQLYSLGFFGNSVGIAASIPSLPPLPNLKELIILQSDLYRVGNNFPDLTPATIERLWLSTNQLNNAASEAILSKVLASTSGSSITDLVLNENFLTRIPQQIKSFTQLKYLNVIENDIAGVFAGDLSLKSQVAFVDISKNPIENNFEAGSFAGDFSSASIVAAAINMTTLAADVFQGVLEQMALPGNQGSITLAFNTFNCDCDLAWLLRDNRNLLNVVENAICSDQVLFQNTTPDQFQNCP